MSLILQEKNKIAYQYCEAIQGKLLEICSPLAQLGITFFGHMKLFNDGTFLHISNNMRFQKDYYFFKGGGFGGDIFLNVLHANIKNKEYFLTPCDNISIKKDRIIEISINNNIMNSFTIYINDKGYLSVYFFGTYVQGLTFSLFFLKNILLLEHFIQYFNERAGDLIDITNKSKLGQFEGQFNFCNPSEANTEEERIQEFLRETQLQSFSLKTKNREILLSKRQAECLYNLSLGKSAKESGRILSLSPRTIDYYINNLKQKSELNTGELLTYFLKSNPIFLM